MSGLFDPVPRRVEWLSEVRKTEPLFAAGHAGCGRRGAVAAFCFSARWIDSRADHFFGLGAGQFCSL